MSIPEIASLSVGPFEVAQLTSAQLQYQKVARLDAPQSIVFEALASHKQWPNLFPWVQAVSVDNSRALVPNGLGARRTCYFGNNLMLEELIVGWHPPHAYAYAGLEESHPFGMRNHVGIIRCKLQDNRTILSWQHYFEHCNLAAMLQQLDGTMTAVIQNLIDFFGGKLLKTHSTIKSSKSGE